MNLLVSCMIATFVAMRSVGGFGIDEETASQLQPFYGQNSAPVNGTTNIYISMGVEKLTNVDDANFLFEGVFR